MSSSQAKKYSISRQTVQTIFIVLEVISVFCLAIFTILMLMFLRETMHEAVFLSILLIIAGFILLALFENLFFSSNLKTGRKKSSAPFRILILITIIVALAALQFCFEDILTFKSLFDNVKNRTALITLQNLTKLTCSIDEFSCLLDIVHSTKKFTLIVIIFTLLFASVFVLSICVSFILKRKEVISGITKYFPQMFGMGLFALMMIDTCFGFQKIYSSQQFIIIYSIINIIISLVQFFKFFIFLITPIKIRTRQFLVVLIGICEIVTLLIVIIIFNQYWTKARRTIPEDPTIISEITDNLSALQFFKDEDKKLFVTAYLGTSQSYLLTQGIILIIFIMCDIIITVFHDYFKSKIDNIMIFEQSSTSKYWQNAQKQQDEKFEFETGDGINTDFEKVNESHPLLKEQAQSGGS